MATIQAKNLLLKISTDGVTYRSNVCEISSGISKSWETESTSTKCDNGETLVALGAKTRSIPFSAVVKTDPLATQFSWGDIDYWFEQGTLIYFKIADDSGYVYQQGRGYVTELNLTADNGRLVEYEGTITVDGGTTFDYADS